LKRALRSIAYEISQSMALELGSNLEVEKSTSLGVTDLLLQSLISEVVRQVQKTNHMKGISEVGLEARLQRVERSLEKLATGLAEEVEREGEDEDETAGTGSSFPNLKYAKPKYKNVESILKYAESDEDKGGVKLVIMNFND